MLEKLVEQRNVMDMRGTFLIRVLGDLDASWLDYFDDVSIVVSTPFENAKISTLCARHADQAALLGILTSLNQYGYAVFQLQLLDVA